MFVTVVVCTFNRCNMLAKALESVTNSRLPSTVEWEVLVVDNNSSDQTREVVKRFDSCYPGRFRYIFEPRQGVAYARNTGVSAAGGDVIAFTDDDVTVDPSWLNNLTAPLHNRAWAGVAGRVVPVWQCPRPNWLSPKDTRGVAIEFDLGPVASDLAEPAFTVNLCFRKELFEKHGGFRVDLGRTGDKLLSNEDVEFCRRLMQAGERFRYEPTAVVYHPVFESRLNKKYFQSWWYGKGFSDIKQSGVSTSNRQIYGIPVRLFWVLATCTARWLLSVKPERRFSWKLNVWCIAGEIVASYQASHGVSPSDRKPETVTTEVPADATRREKIDSPDRGRVLSEGESESTVAASKSASLRD